ncbi:DMT family transporter [bacterium]|nr:MAG: DMT family transporter [bacterium]
MHVWLPLAAMALVAWSLQRLLSKIALKTLTTAKFYLLSATISLFVYLPYLLFHPPAASELLPALGLACLMAVTFWVTTEAIRRGPLGVVSPVTALSPALTAALAIGLIGERPGWLAYAGIAIAPAGVALLSAPGGKTDVEKPGWMALAIASLVLQGLGAFVAKLVVTPAGPSALLLMGAGVQVLVGLALAPPWRWTLQELSGRPALYTVFAYSIAGIATIGYLSALASGPAAVVVPLVSTSPALAGILGVVLLKERLRRRQLAGLLVALVGAALLAGEG